MLPNSATEYYTVQNEKQLDVSVLYRCLAAIFTVVIASTENSSLSSLHGPCL